MSALITHLKSKQLLWQASQTTPVTDKIATGIDLLDKALQGGFPKRGLARIHSTMGIGELRLCMPVLKQRQQDQRQLFIIAPPASINAEMLHEYKLSIERTFFINSENQAGQLWACEQCLKSILVAASIVAKNNYYMIIFNAFHKSQCWIVVLLFGVMRWGRSIYEKHTFPNFVVQYEQVACWPSVDMS